MVFIGKHCLVGTRRDQVLHALRVFVSSWLMVFLSPGRRSIPRDDRREDIFGRGADVRRGHRPIAREVFVEPVRIAGVRVVGVQLIGLAAESADASMRS